MRRTGPRRPRPLRCLRRVGHAVDRTQMVFMFSENIPGSPGYGGRGDSACRSLALFHGGRGPETVSDGRELCPWAWHARGQGAAGTQGVTREAGGSQRCASSRRDPGTPTERGRHWLDPLRPRAPRLGSLRRSKSPSVGRRVRFTPVLLTTRPLWPDARCPEPVPFTRRTRRGAVGTAPRVTSSRAARFPTAIGVPLAALPGAVTAGGGRAAASAPDPLRPGALSGDEQRDRNVAAIETCHRTAPRSPSRSPVQTFTHGSRLEAAEGARLDILTTENVPLSKLPRPESAFANGEGWLCGAVGGEPRPPHPARGLVKNPNSASC